MADILDYLKQIANSIYGKDVRSSIVNAIRQCYDDGKAGATDLLARERISNLTKLAEGSTTGDAELADLRVGADGKTYPNAGDAVRGQVSELKGDLSELIDNQKTWVLNSIDLEPGYILDDGTEASHNSRYRTRFIRIRKCAMFFANRLGDDNDNLYSVRVNVYDNSKKHVELKNWANLGVWEKGVKFDSDGYIRVSVQGLSLEDYDKRLSIIPCKLT